MRVSRQLLNVVAFNALSAVVILIAFSFVIRAYVNLEEDININDTSKKYNENTIRATYPNYKYYDRKDALAIFEFAAPKSSYVPFTEWRREPYTSTAVNVGNEFRTRLSVGHSQKDSIWFFGGSTMWGTGAADDATIPSYFAKFTGAKVWNFGESGYNSFQELIQLQIMLVQGYKPKAVVFYDGVNDAQYCNANVRTLPTHGRYDQYLEYISGYNSLREKLKESRAALNDIAEQKTVDVATILAGPVRFIASPYRELFNKYFDKRAVGLKTKDSLSVGKSFSKFRRRRYYRVCDESSTRAIAAASTTVETWLAVHALLESKGIRSYFILQPSAHIKPESLQLDYLLDSEKQRIADEKNSFVKRYQETKEIWNRRCRIHDACDNFLDLSEALVGFHQPVFIDAIHISPNGNELIAKKLSKFVPIK